MGLPRIVAQINLTKGFLISLALRNDAVAAKPTGLR
jgi:hypothetical protein